MSTNTTDNPLTLLIVRVMYIIAMTIGIIASVVLALLVGVLLVLCVIWNLLYFLGYCFYDFFIVKHPALFLVIFGAIAAYLIFK